MKTFTSIHKFPKGSCGYREGARRIFVVWADPKRDGLYRMTEFQAGAGKTKQFSFLYGKSNQEKILKYTKDMIEVSA